jgi:hypothetical protein
MWRILVEMIGALGGVLGIAVMLGQMIERHRQHTAEKVVGKFLDQRRQQQEGKANDKGT